MLSTPAQKILRDILQFADYSLSRISVETGISRATLSRIYRNCCGIVQLRVFNKLFRLYCRLLSEKSRYGR